MSDKRQFLKHTLIFGIGGTLAQIAPLILFPLYTNYLTPADYGILDVINRVTEVINVTLLIGGIRLAAIVFYRQAESEKERRTIAVTLSLLLWGLIGLAILISIVFSGYFDHFLKTNNPQLLAFGMTVALMETITSIPMTLMQARLESIRYVMISWTMMFFRVGLCVLFVAILHWGIWGVFASSFCTLTLFGIILNVREFFIGSFCPDFSKWKDVLKFALPFIPTGLLYFITSNMDRYMLINHGPYHDADSAFAAIGIWAVAVRLVGIAGSFGSGPLKQVWASVIYDVRKQDDAPFAFGHFALRMLFVHTFFVLGISIFAPEIIRGICAPSYYSAVVLIPICAAQSIFGVIIYNNEQPFYVEKKTYLKIIIDAAGLLFIFTFLYYLIPYGIVGVALAVLFKQIAVGFVQYCISQRVFPIRYPFGKMALLFGITVVIYWASTLAGNAVSLGNITFEQLTEFSKRERIWFLLTNLNYMTLLIKACIILVWFLLVWNSGILSKDDKEFATDMFKKLLHKLPVLRRFSR
jgi:O-antigen/teichoic acid export membrane protein